MDIEQGRKGANHRYYILDQDNPGHVEGWCYEKSSELGKLDVVIHNAGLSMRGLLMDTEIEVGERLLNVDFLSVFAMTQALVDNMNTDGQGSVV